MQDTPKLGQLCDENSRRDAVHIAVAPIVAGHILPPNEPVKLNEKGEAVSCPDEEAIGLVDPFLTLKPAPNWVDSGERFWLYLKPGTVTGIRHVWTHPAFQPRIPIKE